MIYFRQFVFDLFITLPSLEFWDFVLQKNKYLGFTQKILFIYKIFKITLFVKCPHTNKEILKVSSKILSLSKDIKGVLVECGTYKGGSAAKLSLVAKFLKRDLYIFDSFTGIPANNEIQTYLNSDDPSLFVKGSYNGNLNEVKTNIQKYGEIKNCCLVKGLFDKTLPLFNKNIASIFVDVDLMSSNRSVLKNLYKLISKGGYYFCHDGHLTLVVDLYRNKKFWKTEIGVKKPHFQGLGKDKLFYFKKS